MWVFDNEYNKWISNDDILTRDNYTLFLQSLQDVRFYSKCLSGAVFSPVNDLNDIYDVLGKYTPQNFYIGVEQSQYTNTLIPSKNPVKINSDYYTKFQNEYGLSLKTLFTPKRIMDDSVNYIYVDIATTEKLTDIGKKVKDLIIDGVKLVEGHKVLIKDQFETVVLLSTQPAEEFFLGNYEVVENLGSTIEYRYYSGVNGIYTYTNEALVRSTEFSDYLKCKRFSVNVKNGNSNLGKQFHLSRLRSGYYPITGEPMEFIEKKNWLVRNRVDYNNMFEINYYDVIKHGTQLYNIEGITYSIPERIISIGEFGVILNTQGGISNIIKNKYKVNLRSISETTTHYWICGDKGILIKVRKHDFRIERIELQLDNKFSIRLLSVAFFNDLRGVVVGDLNTIFITADGGNSWKRLRVPDFDSFYFNKVVFKKPNIIWIAGNTGVFLELIEDISGWTAYRRRIARNIDDEEEYLLVDNINDMLYATASWGLTFSYPENETIIIKAGTEGTLGTGIFIYFTAEKIGTHNGKSLYRFYTEPFAGGSTGGFYYIWWNNITYEGFDPSWVITHNQYGSFESNENSIGIANIANSWDRDSPISIESEWTQEHILYVFSIYSPNTTKIDKELLFLCCDESKIIAYDINDSINKFEFIYLDFGDDYGDILNISKQADTNNFYFTGIEMKTGESGLFTFNLDNFQYIGVGNSSSNTTLSTNYATLISPYFPNEIFDYKGQELLIAGNESLFYQGTYSTNLDFYIPDENFEKRLKSKLLFLDYDIGAKLNFFTDFGEYRLPNEVQIPTSFSLEPGGSIGFSPLIISATFPSFVTQSEANWWSYWTDKEKDFEYYSNGVLFSESTKVLMSNTFSYSPLQTSKVINTISDSFSDIQYLAPKIGQRGHSRYNGLNSTNISPPPSTKELFVYDYLMVYKTTSTYPVNVGDVMKFTSQIVEGNFIVNKIYATGSSKYIYMFTNFNENITTNLKSVTASIVNLNKYSSKYEFIDRFSLHPMSYGYECSLVGREETGRIWLDFSNGFATYSGWSMSSNFVTASSFQINQTSIDLDQISSSPYSISANTIGLFTIETPELKGVNNIKYSYYHNKGLFSSGTYSSISVKGLSGSIWYQLNVLNIPSMSPNSPMSNSGIVSFSFNDDYKKFKFDIKNVGFTPTNPGGSNSGIRIDDIIISSDSKLEGASSSYGLKNSTFDDILVKAKFNYLSAYYNLATNINVTGNFYTMSYTDGFLNFGYSPTYNLLTYLEGLNDYNDLNPKFRADKEYYALPEYRAIPMPGGNNFESNQAYIDYNGITFSSVYPERPFSTSNKILFGKDLKFEWESIMINTFVDIHLYDTEGGKWPDVEPTTTTEKALVMKKYYDPVNDYYVIEFNKKIVHYITEKQYWLDIVSRRKLIQISEDLKELNNIQRPLRKKRELSVDGTQLESNGHDYFTYEPELNFKLNTDSYAKVLLSDVDTITSLSGIMYSDYKGELSLNITRLDEEYSIPIQYTGNYQGKVFIFCSKKHGLKDDDGVVLEFNGGVGSSEDINQNYIGYQTVKVINENNFIINLPYGKNVLTGQDTGFVKYTKSDPFLGFEPVDLIDVGADKRGKISIELETDNTQLSSTRYFLSNVNFNKLRYRLIDGLNLDTIVLQYPWILEAEISNAVIGFSGNELCWYRGIWECGRWFGGRWVSGQWVSGDWYGGTWDAKNIKDRNLQIEIEEKSSVERNSIWYNGRWFGGQWNNGLWVNGRWYDGTWNTGTWYKGIWNDGTWNNGEFTGGIWVRGKWNAGIFNCDNEPAYWIDGYWNAGDFENGMWFNGTFDEKNGDSRFGVWAYNSRTATWHAGNWIKGSFYSRLNTDEEGEDDVSVSHKYAIWRTGNWLSGDFYGGIAYNINWKSGTWHGGILEDIQVIGFGNDGTGKYYFTLNGIFKFNTGDKFTIIDNGFEQEYSIYGSNDNPKIYIVLDTEEIPEKKWTKVFIASIISQQDGAPNVTEIDTTLRVVSRFTTCNWKSGIWTNGIYESGLWEGGIWYNGIFNATWM
jgi:hypothetical protein